MARVRAGQAMERPGEGHPPQVVRSARPVPGRNRGRPVGRDGDGRIRRPSRLDQLSGGRSGVPQAGLRPQPDGRGRGTPASNGLPQDQPADQKLQRRGHRILPLTRLFRGRLPEHGQAAGRRLTRTAPDQARRQLAATNGTIAQKHNRETDQIEAVHLQVRPVLGRHGESLADAQGGIRWLTRLSYATDTGTRSEWVPASDRYARHGSGGDMDRVVVGRPGPSFVQTRPELVV